jgi:hypothetical protein
MNARLNVHRPSARTPGGVWRRRHPARAPKAGPPGIAGRGVPAHVPRSGGLRSAIALLVLAVICGILALAQKEARGLTHAAEERHGDLAVLDPDRLAAIDGAGLVTALDNDPAGWIARLQITPLVSAADGWSCICARMLQLGEVETISGWLSSLAGGPGGASEAWLAIDSADTGMPPHHAHAREFGAAVSGCLMALEDLAERDPDAARDALRQFRAAAGVAADPDHGYEFGMRALFDQFWPEAQGLSGAAYAAFASQWRSAGARLHCQSAVRRLW